MTHPQIDSLKLFLADNTDIIQLINPELLELLKFYGICVEKFS